MFKPTVLLSFVFAALVAGQQVGTYEAETHPRLSIQECRGKNQCTTVQKSVVLDANWRWAHIVGDYKNCYTGNSWDSSACPSPSACAKNCAIEGVNYSGTYGITTSGNQLNIRFVTKHEHGTNVGGRVYLMNGTDKYYMFKLLNKEFTFDVDVSQLGCGLNGALYFISMPENGGLGTGNNRAGAKYGTGYCDAQCPHDMKWIEGEANTDEWRPHEDDENAGRGKYGACCDEMDIWEANSISNAYTPHTCSRIGKCEGLECGDNGPDRYQGICDKDGCDFNPYRMGDRDYYGKGKTVDTTKKMTVVTQFLTDNNQDNGRLVEIRRIYVQNGQVIQNTRTMLPGLGDHDSITEQFCDDAKAAFNDVPHYQQLGGHQRMGDELGRGMVLAMSIWGDFYARMLWLDSSYPLDRDPEAPGIARGECPQDGGHPHDIIDATPNATVMFSNIKVGPLNSTY